MKEIIKKFAPEFVIKHLLVMKKNFYDPWEKKRLVKKVEQKHLELLKKIGSKEKKRVIFLAIFESAWKFDTLFKKLLADSQFEPIILVCPYTIYGEDQMNEEMQKCINFFKGKGYPVLSSFDNERKEWISLDELKPDLLFFTNPHNLTRKEYYQDAYLNYLSCYAGYGMPVSRYDDYQAQFNQKFHNAMWNIFVQTPEMIENYNNYSMRKSNNVFFVGDCFVEELRNRSIRNKVWKVKNNKMKKIIWAPHHTISSDDAGDFQIGTFLENYQLFKDLAQKTRESVHWVFKPHPILKSKLYLHSDWGQAKTDAFYKFWEESENTQYEDGDYVDLFKESDALILDCSSFLGEYMFTLKPILYLKNKNTDRLMSGFGAKCLEASYISKEAFEVEEFLENIIYGKDDMHLERLKLVNDFDRLLGAKKVETSDLILNILTKEFEGA